VNGVLIIDVEIGECGPPPGGDSDVYQRELDEFEGELTFFIEFRLNTNGDRSEIIGQAPAAISASGFGEVRYRWTIARDQVKLVRDVLLPILFLDIEPDIFHTYRLELRDTTSYAWFIDGVIPVDGSGDFDTDGQINDNDQFFFEECLDNSGENVDAGPGCRWADFDADTDVDCDDWDAFDAAWTGAGNPTEPAACAAPPIPAVSTWGMMVTVLTLLSCGTIMIRRRKCRACPRS
ncbi:MAG: hypothetical protein IH991_08195, partial [Planctomycetes bacterium]|nr:hypothetical protein [Planctomycetota bacterium]